MGISMVLIVIGFMLMGRSGGREKDSEERNFSAQRIKVAPWICMTGYLGIGASLFLPTKRKIICKIIAK